MRKYMALLVAAFAVLAAWATDITVGPLLTTKWDQISPYINFGPIKPDQEEGYSYENHMVNGCVAVAYSQVLKYWNWPEVLDEDITYSHMANSTPGYVQTLPAGTEFNWDKQLDDYVTTKSTQAQQLYLGLGQIYTAMLTEMKFNLTMSGVNLERAIDNSYYNPGNLINTVGQTTLEMCKDQARDSIVGGMPLIMGVTVNYSGSSISHAIVGDGWKESEGSDPQISCNYGWGGTRDGFTAFNLETSRFIANLKPRPMVIIDAVPYHAALPVKVSWHFPKKGYETALTGFNVNAYKVTDTTYTWKDNFDSQQGSLWGEGVSIGTLDGCGNDGNMLKFSTESGRDYYAWPTMFLGEGSVLSFRVRSDHIRSHQTAWVEAYEAHRGWKKIRDLTLYEFPPTEDNGWVDVSINLDTCYNNKAVGFRIRTARAASGDNWSQSLAYGIQIDDMQVTNVRKVETEPTASKTIASNLRSASFDSGLNVGSKYMFVVEPIVKDGVKSNATGAEIVASEPEKVRFYGVQSIHDGDPQFDSENIFREAYLGTNQFAVFGSPTMTKLRAKLSQTQLIDYCLVPDVAGAPGDMIASCEPVSVADAVKVECAEPGKFLVTVDFSCCTKALLYTREIITLEGEDDLGNIVRKNIVMRFSQIGNEKAITKEQIPAYGGTIPSEEEEEEEEEEQPVTCLVTFVANYDGGSSSSKNYTVGDTIGSFPSVSRAEYTLDGWYTEATGGTEVFTSTKVTGVTTYYAHWLKDTTPDPDPGEDPDEPSGGDDPVVDPTDGNANDFTEGGVNYRFCNGVDKTSGYKDVSRVGYYGYQAPGAYNLVLWWADAYQTAKGSYPTGYTAPSTSSFPNDGTITTFPDLAVKLFKESMLTALPTDTERAAYFSTTAYTSAQWCDNVSVEAAVKVAGRRIFAMLNNGPIGILIPTSSSRSYGGVIWGCKYESDADGNYATVVYFTSTRLNNNDMENATLANVTVSGVGTMPGLKGFNSNGGVIKTYYPIVGPVASSGGDDEPDDPVVTPTTFTVTFDANGGTSCTSTLEVEEGKTIAELPTAELANYTFDGWFDSSNNKLTTATQITADVTYTARWTVVTPEEPEEPEDSDPEEPDPEDPVDPDEPVISGQQAGGNAVDTGTISTTYGYRLVYNYWLARKLALQEKKKLFILSGASWCSYCTHTKEYLQGLGTTFTDKFVVYYVDRDNLSNSPYFKGGLPQYGSADPLTVNPFAGIYGDGTSGTPDWTKAWYASGNGLYYGNRGGFSQDEISRTLSAASDQTFGDFERLEIRGPKSVMSDKANTYQLYAIFTDGSEMLVDHGVTWSLMSGAGTMVVSTSDGDASTKLTVTSDQAVLRAESTYYFSGTVDFTINSTQESKIKGLTIVTDTLNLEDNRSPILEATATLDDDTVVAISGVGTWTINSYTKKARSDAELESSQDPVVTVDEFGQLTYDQGYQFDVYDHTLNVTLTANGVSVTKDITVWGPTKVAPVSWTLASKTKRLTRYGVVRLKCSQLKYNYGGEIKTTSDTYYGNFRTVMQFAGSSSEYSYLRGLAFMSSKTTAGTWTMGLQSQRVNGQYQYWTPDNFANYHSESIVNVAEGDTITDADHGLVPQGFFDAYWQTECAGKSETELQAFALLDSDDDGFANWQEYILGTDPTDKSDALYLTQGYQHLTAPANDLEAFQYKIMFAQRPGRYYYIYAKENWGDEWTRVAKINYSGMAADQGLQITILNETKANNGNFFRVGSVLADHEFNGLSSAEVIPDLLVAAPNSVIDLTSETLPLNLISFDTDATHAGTVNVKVPESARTPGKVLISAPKSAKASLEACQPYESGDVEFEVVEDPDDASRMVLKVKGDSAPTIEGGDEKGTVVVEDEKIIVTPADNVTEITLVNPGEKQVEIPPSIGRIGGVTDSTKIVIRQSFGDDMTVDLTPLMKLTQSASGFDIALDESKKDVTVDVDGEQIRLEPELASGESETPFEMKDGEIIFNVKSIPGLKYQVIASDSLDTNGFTPQGSGQSATSSRSVLKITPGTGATKGFYKIRVSATDE